jgi:hypothetical protein
MPHLGPVPLAEVGPLLIQRLYADLLGRGLSGGTVVNLHLVLTQAFSQALRWGIIPVNPVAGAQPPRPRCPEIAIVDPDLAGRILQAVEGTAFEVTAAVAIATFAPSRQGQGSGSRRACTLDRVRSALPSQWPVLSRRRSEAPPSPQRPQPA